MTHYVAIGGNLPAPDGLSALQSCERAARWVSALPYAQGCVRSRWFSTAPIPASGQPRFINGVIRLEGQVTPERLLFDLQALEGRGGRVRGEVDAARTLDLDIIDMAGESAGSDPVLPHPRAHLRAFVLLPLRDVAPRWVHRRLQAGIGELLERVSGQDVRPL